MTMDQINNLTREELIKALLATAHNCNSKINDLQDRIRDLESENAALKAKLAPPPLTWDLPAWTITPGTRKGAIEIYFDKMPGTGIIAQLKDLKMRWNAKKKCWYGFVPPADIEYLFNQATAAA